MLIDSLTTPVGAIVAPQATLKQCVPGSTIQPRRGWLISAARALPPRVLPCGRASIGTTSDDNACEESLFAAATAAISGAVARGDSCASLGVETPCAAGFAAASTRITSGSVGSLESRQRGAVAVIAGSEFPVISKGGGSSNPQMEIPRVQDDTSETAEMRDHSIIPRSAHDVDNLSFQDCTGFMEATYDFDVPQVTFGSPGLRITEEPSK
jgi:hypothetical protein